jgi:hypothetical protein
LQVRDAADLADQAGALLMDKARRDAISAAAAGWRRDNGGGVERTLSIIRAELAKAP